MTTRKQYKKSGRILLAIIFITPIILSICTSKSFLWGIVNLMGITFIGFAIGLFAALWCLYKRDYPDDFKTEEEIEEEIQERFYK